MATSIKIDIPNKIRTALLLTISQELKTQNRSSIMSSSRHEIEDNIIINFEEQFSNCQNESNDTEIELETSILSTEQSTISYINSCISSSFCMPVSRRSTVDIRKNIKILRDYSKYLIAPLIKTKKAFKRMNRTYEIRKKRVPRAQKNASFLSSNDGKWYNSGVIN